MADGILDRIAASKAEEISTLRARRKDLARAARDMPPPRPVLEGLRGRRQLGVFAEVKRRSPGAGDIDPQLEPAELACAYEAGGATAVSVLTDGPWFGGSLADLGAVARAVGIPVLRKDFVLDPVQLAEARAAGADMVLLIARLLDGPLLADLEAEAREMGMTALVEVHDERELAAALEAEAALVGVNNRDLRTFATDLAVTERLARHVPPNVVLVSESGIAEAKDARRVAEAGADAVLVGEALVRSGDPRAGVAALAAVERRGRGRVWARWKRGRGVGVKICGVTEAAGARAAETAGASFMGVILSPGYGRSVPVERARGLYGLFSGVRVGVFVDAGPGRVSRAAEELALDVVQLHGGESPETAARIADAGPWAVWKSFSVKPGRSLSRLAREVEAYRGVLDGVLADAWHDGAPGGTGRSFAWAGVGDAVRECAGEALFVVAGGLGPENVAAAVGALGPDVVDASSGVESAVGVKDAAKAFAFVEAARRASAAGRRN